MRGHGVTGRQQQRPAPDVRERALRIVREHTKDHASRWATITPITPKQESADASMRTDLVLDALEQALYDRQTDADHVHPSDRGVQCSSLQYNERVAESRIATSVGNRGDADDTALAESVIGLYETAVIRHAGPWRPLEDVEYATLETVAWYDQQRLPEPLGYVPPAEYEDQ